MQYEFRAPALRALVRPAWGQAYGDGVNQLPGLIAPDAHLEFVFQTGAPCALSTAGQERASPPAMVFGLRHGALRLAPRGANRMIAFRLPPVLAAVVLGVGISACWDEPVPLADLIGPAADDLLDEISAGSFDQACSTLEAWLLGRLQGWDADHARQMWLQRALLWRWTDQPVSALADELGFTSRTLRRHCERHAGLSPKQIVMSGRILRSCDLLLGPRKAPLAEIAGVLGFTDQSAFTSAFRRYMGMTPAQLRREPLVHYERSP